jgi:7-cyano-7-deazaguanine synthase in queuosine biosynthesis
MRGLAMHVVQLLSGGFDSVGQALYLQSQGHTIHPMYVKFRKGGGKVAKELLAVKVISREAGFQEPHVITHRISREEYDTRNRTLVMLAGEYAQRKGAEAVAIGSHLFEGVELRGDFPREDADPAHLQRAAPEGIKVLASQMYKAPLLLDLPLEVRHHMFKSTSCQMWYTDDCGRCFSCIERHAAFIMALGYDHTVYTYDPKQTERWVEYLTAEQKALANAGDTHVR